jgi:hypothetical protein
MMRALLLLALGCSSAVETVDTFDPPAHGLQIASEPYELEAGEEITRCFYQNLDNTEALDVERFETSQLLGLHHFNVFVSDLDKPNGYAPCPTYEELFVGARPIVDGSAGAVDYAFPSSMALRLEPKSLLIFQLHSINTTDGPLTQQFLLNVHTKVEPAPTLVDIYGFTNFGIEIPPKSTKVESKDCVLYDAVGLISMSSHFHQRGTLATVDFVSKDGSRVERIYENESWDDPQVLFFDRSLRIDPGDTIRFACHYDNPDDVTVEYGPSGQDEMCFVFGYYFPKVGLIPCF